MLDLKKLFIFDIECYKYVLHPNLKICNVAHIRYKSIYKIEFPKVIFHSLQKTIGVQHHTR